MRDNQNRATEWFSSMHEAFDGFTKPAERLSGPGIEFQRRIGAALGVVAPVLTVLATHRPLSFWIKVRTLWEDEEDGFSPKETRDIHRDAASSTLIRHKVTETTEDGTTRAIPRARDLLADAIAEHCRAIKGAIGWKDAAKHVPLIRPETVADADARGWSLFPPPEDGMLWLDARLFEYLKKAFPDWAKDELPQYRESARARLAAATEDESTSAWDLWWREIGAFGLPEIINPVSFRTSYDMEHPFLVLLATALWEDRVREQWEREKTHRPAIVRAVVADRLIPAMTRQFSFAFDEVVTDAKGRELGRVMLTDRATAEMVQRGLGLLGSVAGHRLIRRLVHSAYDAYEEGAPDPRKVMFHGGWSALADVIGHRTGNLKVLRDLAIAGQCVHWKTPYVEFAGLWTFAERRGSRNGGPGLVSFVLGDPLVPGYAAGLKRSDGSNTPAKRIARRLVPELRYEPPVRAVNERSWGAVWTLHRLALVELVDLAEDIFRIGAARILPERWRTLAKKAGLPFGKIELVLDSWLTGDGTAPPLLEQPERNHWILAKDHATEMQFIRHQGERRTAGRKSGRRGKRR